MRSRIRAFLIHLTASVILALLAMLLVFGVWYPAPLHKAVGVTGIFFLVLGVDVIIGPALTFIVYKVGKKSLRFDLATIVCLQLAAFIYGLWTVAEGRPAWLVFTADRFDLVQAYQIDTRKLDQAKPDYRSPPWLGPAWVSAQHPTEREERNKVLMEALFSGIGMVERPELYQPLEGAASAMREHAKALDELKRYNAADAVAKVRADWPEADAFLPMMSKVQPVTVLIQKEAARVIAVVDLKPWE